MLLPLPERFFAGGDTGPRGFRFDAVGPQVVGANGERYATGGNALLLGGAELRYNVTRAVQFASFLDVGNVYPQVERPRPRRAAPLAPGSACATARRSARCASTGATCSTRSPATQSRSRFHLTIGHAF